jgi:hypothetical protein
MKNNYVLKEYDRVLDKCSGKKGKIVYVAEENNFLDDVYIFEPDDYSFDPSFRCFDDLVPVE